MHAAAASVGTSPLVTTYSATPTLLAVAQSLLKSCCPLWNFLEGVRVSSSNDKSHQITYARVCTYLRAYLRTHVPTYVRAYVRTNVGAGEWATVHMSGTYVRAYVRTYVRTYVGAGGWTTVRMSGAPRLPRFIHNDYIYNGHLSLVSTMVKYTRTHPNKSTLQAKAWGRGVSNSYGKCHIIFIHNGCIYTHTTK